MRNIKMKLSIKGSDTRSWCFYVIIGGWRQCVPGQISHRSLFFGVLMVASVYKFWLKKGNGSSYSFSCHILLQKEGSNNVSDGGRTGQSTASLPNTVDISDGGIDRHSSAVVPFTATDEQMWRYQGCLTLCFINSWRSFSKRSFCST